MGVNILAVFEAGKGFGCGIGGLLNWAWDGCGEPCGCDLNCACCGCGEP
jgi:hypothetical protein